MDRQPFDDVLRALAVDGSRRSLLRRAASSALAGPLTLVGVDRAAADGKKNKDKDKDKDKGNQGRAVGAGNRDIGHPCAGNQECRAGLSCWPTGPGSVPRCTDQPPPERVQTSAQVCAEDCPPSVGVTTAQTVLVDNAERFGRPPSYWIDVVCTFDAPRFRTVCDCIGFGEPGAPLIRAISLPAADICAFVITEEQRPAGEQPRSVTNVATGGDANAGTGGVANAEASGGSVTIGDVRGNNDIAIDASGGTANADASGGDNNVAIAGGAQMGSDAAQAVELGTLTLTLEGQVAPGKLTTYWVETDAGRRPATGPALVHVADEAQTSGAIVAEVRICDLTEPQEGYDWFGQCTTPAVDLPYSVAPERGGTTPLATMTTNAQGRAHFANLAPGTYQFQSDGPTWCYAESDRVDANGHILVEAGTESHVWSFICGAPLG